MSNFINCQSGFIVVSDLEALFHLMRKHYNIEDEETKFYNIFATLKAKHTKSQCQLHEIDITGIQDFSITSLDMDYYDEDSSSDNDVL